MMMAEDWLNKMSIICENEVCNKFHFNCKVVTAYIRIWKF